MTTDLQRFPVVFDSEAYFERRTGSRPLPACGITPGNAADRQALAAALRVHSAELFKPPAGILRHSYIVPGGGYDQLWDWDAYFCGLALCEERPDAFKGCVLNFLDHLQADGRPPHLIEPGGPSYRSIPLPLFAQWAVAACRVDDAIDWLRPTWPALLAQRAWFDRRCTARRGLYRLPAWPGHGLDNDPVIYGRRGDCVGAVHVNCYHQREFRALAWLAARLGHRDEAERYRVRALELARAIDEYMWDPIDGLHYHLDLSDHEDVRGQAITWELPYKVRSWACLYPLWAGLCNAEQARRIVEEHVLEPKEFLSPYGIRSLAANERIYNNAAMGNPSNWQGPVWGMSTFLTAYGLRRYGYVDEAIDVAARLVDLLAADQRDNGTIHEYYHADSGAPVMKPGFLSWNLLAVRVLDDLAAGRDPTDIPAAEEDRAFPATP